MPWDLKTTNIIMSTPGRSPLCVDLCIPQSSVIFITCQFCRVLAPPRLGGAIGYPRPLDACEPAFSPAKQHDAYRVEGMTMPSRYDRRLLKPYHSQDVCDVGVGHMYCGVALLSSSR